MAAARTITCLKSQHATRARQTSMAALRTLMHVCQVASSVWFDMSPVVDVQRKITPGDARVWVTKYARLLRLAHDSVARNLAGLPAMLYVRCLFLIFK